MKYARAILALGAGLWGMVCPGGNYTIEVAPHAKVWEQTAARELREHLGQITETLCVGGETGVVFHVGETTLAAEKGLGTAAFEDEAWAVKSFGRDVVLNGGGTRGCLYAVYHFLEDVCGVRWWADGETDVPAVQELKLDALDMKGRPFFAYRGLHRTARATDPITAVRNRVNFDVAARERADLGGTANFAPPYYCHNWNEVLPFAKYGKDHPEWYSLRAGKRVGGAYDGQLCTTCPGLAAAFAERAIPFIERGIAEAAKLGLPPPRYFDLSMNDNRKFCLCSNCVAETARSGHSGRQIRFANHVAAQLGARYPNLKFTTFAYYHSEPVPTDDTRAADNLIVRVCDTRGNLAAAVSDKTNGFMRRQIADWAKYAKQLFVWDYMITYYRSETFDFPLPSELYYGDKFRYYAEHSVKGLFVEHERPQTADMHAVKYWMEAKLLENPFRDGAQLFEEAMTRYYGTAADVLMGIRRELAEACAEYGGYITYEPVVSAWNWLSDEKVADFLGRLDAVEKRVANDAKTFRRVKRFRHAFEAVRELRAEFDGLRPAEDGVAAVPFWEFTPHPLVFTVSPSATNVIQQVADRDAKGGRAMRLDNSDGRHPMFGLPFEWGYYDATGEKIHTAKITAAAGPGYNWYELPEMDFPEHSSFLYFNARWSLQMNIAAPLLKGRVRVRMHAKFDQNATFIDRVVIIPVLNKGKVGSW